MTHRPLRIILASILLLASTGWTSAASSRSTPVFDSWSVDCSNTGLCLSSTYVREQAAWLDLRLVRNWVALSVPMIRLTTNLGLKADGNIRFTIDGKQIEVLPVAQLREIQPSITTPDGFTPIGGEGFWYPTGPATKTLVAAMESGNTLIVELPADPSPIKVKVPLNGFTSASEWIDTEQQRTGTVSALINTGDEEARDAPHAASIADPRTLPPFIAEQWNARRFCSDIDPALFAGLGSVSAVFDDKSTLYLLPCGAPSAYNAAYIALLATSDGKTRQLSFARMSDAGPVAIDLIYNARWNPRTLQLEGLFKASGLGECGLWSRWQWNGSTFVLIEEATRSTCSGQPTPLEEWATTWPLRQYDE